MDRRPDLKQVLWRNVRALMLLHYKKENMSRLAAEAKIGLGSVERIKKMETSVGMDILEAIARTFKLEAWQLLVHPFSPDHPPELAVMTQRERDLYARIREAAQLIAAEPAPPYSGDQ